MTGMIVREKESEPPKSLGLRSVPHQSVLNTPKNLFSKWKISNRKEPFDHPFHFTSRVPPSTPFPTRVSKATLPVLGMNKQFGCSKPSFVVFFHWGLGKGLSSFFDSPNVLGTISP